MKSIFASRKCPCSDPFAHTRRGFALIVFVLCFLLLGCLISRSYAVYEGTANANMMIRRYERRGQFGKAALWHETAAECLDAISVPLAKILVDHSRKMGDMETVIKMKSEIADARERQKEHISRAEDNWDKASEGEAELEAEKIKIAAFMSEWVHHYPDRFYQFGIYQNMFSRYIDRLRENGRIADALLFEAKASDMCARQYNDVTVRYFKDALEEAKKSASREMIEEKNRQLEEYRKIRDWHLGRSAMLRDLAEQDPKKWPPQADKRDFAAPESRPKLTAEEVALLARADDRLEKILEKNENARQFTWFQGFCWTVSYYSDSWEDLAIAFVDDKTGEVTDLLLSPGDLEERIGQIEDDYDFNLSPAEAAEIASQHPQVGEYFDEHPGAKTVAVYNWDYNCWVVEVIVDGVEIGFVTVSDRTKEVLEVALERDNDR